MYDITDVYYVFISGGTNVVHKIIYLITTLHMHFSNHIELVGGIWGAGEVGWMHRVMLELYNTPVTHNNYQSLLSCIRSKLTHYHYDNANIGYSDLPAARR